MEKQTEIKFVVLNGEGQGQENISFGITNIGVPVTVGSPAGRHFFCSIKVDFLMYPHVKNLFHELLSYPAPSIEMNATANRLAKELRKIKFRESLEHTSVEIRIIKPQLN